MTSDYLYQMEPVFDEAEVTAVADCIRSSWVWVLAPAMRSLSPP
jgi:hypothetical protein